MTTFNFLYHPPGFVRKLFPDFIWKSNCDKILLTFDDGPNAETTPIILDVLEQYGIKAVFFCVGNNILKMPDLTGNILASGHLIGSHTMDHQRIWFKSRKFISQQIQIFNEICRQNFNYDVRYFRPPHGRVDLMTRSALKKFNMKNVMWDLMTADYNNDLNIVKFAVQKYLRKNSIIVMHDSNKSRRIIRQSIQFIVDETNDRGFSFGEPSECLN